MTDQGKTQNTKPETDGPLSSSMATPAGIVQRLEKSVFAINVGLFANFCLALVKTGAGILGNSSALLADGINSTADVVYGVVISIMMKLSAKPADEEHPYGHEQMESVAAVVVGAFVITTAIGIFWKSVDTTYRLYVDGGATGAAGYALWVAVGTVCIKLCLSFWTKRVGESTGNSAVLALAADHKNDVLASLAATVGILFGQMGKFYVDPLAGAIVALIILHTGIDILRDSTSDLMDTVPGNSIRKKIEDIAGSIPQMKCLEEVSAHRFGPWLVVNLTIGVDGNLTIYEGDSISSELEKLIMDKIEFMRRVHVHYHPWDQAHTHCKAESDDILL